MSLGVALTIVGFCLLTEAFFSGSEIAVVSANRLKLKTAAEGGSAGAARALKLLARPEFLLGTCLIGTNLSTVTASTALAAAVVTAWPELPEIAAVVVLFPLILTFGELVPKSVFQHHADRVAPVISYPLWLFSILFRVPLILIEAATTLMFRLTGAEGDVARSVTREDIQLLLEASDELAIDEEDRELIQRVFEFTEARVSEVMIPLIEVDSMPLDASAREAVIQMVEHGRSRFPVYEDRVDNVCGIVHHSDLLFLQDLEVPLSQVMRAPLFIPETMQVESLFGTFQRSGGRIAVPVDEYGGAVGLITMEDMLEEIVGDIGDEHDRPEKHLLRVGEGEWLANARVERETLAEVTGLELPSGSFETLAGFLLERMGRVPKIGGRLIEGPWLYEVTQATDRAIVEVRLKRI
jgi:putative hemolysin